MIGFPERRPRRDLRRALGNLVLGRGPFLTLYLDVSSGQARTDAPTRLRDLLEELPQVSLVQSQVAQSAVERVHDDDCLFAALIDSDGNVVSSGYPDPPHLEVVTLDNLPRLGPILTAEQGLTHHVVVELAGEDVSIMTVPRHGEATHESLVGTDPLSIAPVVQYACRNAGTRLLVLCAPRSALPALEAQVRVGLPIETTLVSIPTDGLTDAELSTEIVVRVATQAAAKTVDLIRLWRFHQTHQEAAAGADVTLGALAQNRAGLVLATENMSDSRRAHFGPQPTALALSEQQGAGPVETDRWHAPLVDVVIRAALIADIPVHMVPNVEHTLLDGLGVILSERAEPGELAALLER